MTNSPSESTPRPRPDGGSPPITDAVAFADGGRRPSLANHPDPGVSFEGKGGKSPLRPG